MVERGCGMGWPEGKDMAERSLVQQITDRMQNWQPVDDLLEELSASGQELTDRQAENLGLTKRTLSSGQDLVKEVDQRHQYGDVVDFLQRFSP